MDRKETGITYLIISCLAYFVVARATAGGGNLWYYWPFLYTGVLSIIGTLLLGIQELILYMDENTDEKEEPVYIPSDEDEDEGEDKDQATTR